MVNEDALIRVGNKGTVIDVKMFSVEDNVKTVVDLSLASEFQIEFSRPNGTDQVVTALKKNGSGTDGILTFTDTNGSVFANALAKKVDGLFVVL